MKHIGFGIANKKDELLERIYSYQRDAIDDASYHCIECKIYDEYRVVRVLIDEIEDDN